MSPIIAMPDLPELGIPAGEKDAGQRVDFKPDKFDLLIENKGYLLAWTRACVCPCSPVSEGSDQPDPNCSMCQGKGWFYFGGNQAQDLNQYRFDPLQQKIINDSNAMIIRGILTQVAREHDPINRLTRWESGTMNLTVRHQNKLGLYDKIVVLDPQIVFSEAIIADGSALIGTGGNPKLGQIRYPVTGVNQLRGHPEGQDAPVEYEHGLDYQANDIGQIVWLDGRQPVTGTRLAVHYHCHPTFLVTEHPHVLRSTLKKFKLSPSTLPTPLGEDKPLPIQAIVRYDFLS